MDSVTTLKQRQFCGGHQSPPSRDWFALSTSPSPETSDSTPSDPSASNGAVVRPLLTPAHIRELAAALDVKPTKTLGQNFVHDANTVRKIIAKAHVKPTDHVVEIGPGLGSLTLGLCDHAAQVTAIEIDPKLAAQIEETVDEWRPEFERFVVIEADAMHVTELPGEPDLLVANLPYNVSVPVLLHMLATFPSLRGGLVMVQAEVADRLAAAPGSKTYGIPSAKAAWYAEVNRVATIGRNVFWPVPNVDSALVSFTCRAAPATKATKKQVFAVVDAAFAQRRKTLRSCLGRVFGGTAQAEVILRKAEVDPQARGETLDIVQFAAIADAALDVGGFVS